jgi:hypothetical protein
VCLLQPETCLATVEGLALVLPVTPLRSVSRRHLSAIEAIKEYIIPSHIFMPLADATGRCFTFEWRGPSPHSGQPTSLVRYWVDQRTIQNQVIFVDD